MLNFPLPTLTAPTGLRAVVTLTMPCAFVTVLGLRCDCGNRTRDAAPRIDQGQLTQLAGCALAPAGAATS